MGTDWQWTNGAWKEVAPFGAVEEPEGKGSYEGQFYPHRGPPVMLSRERTWGEWWYDSKQWIGKTTGMLGAVGESEAQITARKMRDFTEALFPGDKAARIEEEARDDSFGTLLLVAMPLPTPQKVTGPVKGARAVWNWLVATHEGSQLVRSSTTGLRLAATYEGVRLFNRGETPQWDRAATNWAVGTVGAHAFSLINNPTPLADFKDWATTFRLNSPSNPYNISTAGNTAANGGVLDNAATSVDPALIRFSQSSVNGVDEIAASMRANGWQGAPINVVRMGDGTFTTFDNTRVLAASRAGIATQAVIREPGEAFPAGRWATKSGVTPSTWGEAVRLRILQQNRLFRQTYPSGSPFTGSSQ